MKDFLSILKDKEHPDNAFIRSIARRFFVYTAFLVLIFIDFMREFLASTHHPFKLIIWALLALGCLSQLFFSFLLGKTYFKLDEGPNYTPKFLVSWVERKFWKNFNRSHYGWKFLGSYHHRKSYHEGAVRASRNDSLGSSLLASVGPAARLTKKIFDPIYKWAYRKKLANIAFTVDQLNRKANRHLVQPEKQANRDEFDKFQYETSQVYQRQGEQDFEDGYYDQSIYEQYYEDYDE